MAEAFPSMHHFCIGSLESMLELGLKIESGPMLMQGAARIVAEGDDPSRLQACLAVQPDAVHGRAWFGSSLMVLATALRREQSIKVLLEAGASLEEGGIPRLLCVAALSGNARTVRLLLNARAAVGRVDPEDGAELTPLQCAAEVDSSECLQVLLEARAAELEPLDRGHWPLMTACQHGSEKTVAMLIEATPQAIEAVGEGGATPLMMACMFGRARIARMLLEAIPGTKRAEFLKRVDANGTNAIELAAAAAEGGPQSLETVYELLYFGAEISFALCRQFLDLQLVDVQAPIRIWLKRAANALKATKPSWGAGERQRRSPAHWVPLMSAAMARRALRDEHLTLGSLWLGDPSPRQVAYELATRSTDEDKDEEEPGDVPEGASLLLEACGPWSPETHELFPRAARARAVELLKLIHLLCEAEESHRVWSAMSRWWWVQTLIPLDVKRSPPGTQAGTIEIN